MSNDDNICDECEKVEATMECAECELVFCTPCCDTMHSAGELKTHIPTPKSAVQQCDECEENAATLACAECELVFCDGCFAELHQAGELADHLPSHIGNAGDDELDLGLGDLEDDPAKDDELDLGLGDLDVGADEAAALEDELDLGLGDLDGGDGDLEDAAEWLEGVAEADKTPHKTPPPVTAKKVAKKAPVQEEEPPPPITDDDDAVDDDDDDDEDAEAGAVDTAAALEADEHMFNLPDSPDTIIYVSSGNRTLVRAGNKVKLVGMLAHHIFHDTEYQFCFLATFPTFMKAEELIHLLGIRFDAATPPHLTGKDRINFEKKDAPVIKKRVADVLCMWMRDFPSDFKEEEVLDPLKYLIDSPAVDEEKELKKRLNLALLDLDDWQAAANRGGNSGGPSPRPKSLTAESFAKALYALEGELFSNIQLREFLDLAWNGKRKEELAPNVLALIRNSTQVSYMIASEILSEPKVKKRAAMVRLFIEAAATCLMLENFNGVVEVIAGLGLPAVHRLQKTWKLLPKEVIAMYDKLLKLTTEKNYKGIRTSMEATPACIPYLGVLLTDLTFITEANPLTISSKVILTLIPKPGDKTGVKKKAPFDGREPVQKVLEKMLKVAGPEMRSNADGLVLCVAPRKGLGFGQYLLPSKRLYEYEIYNKDTISLVERMRPLRYTISGNMAGTEMVDQCSTVGEILDSLSAQYGIPPGWMAMHFEGRVLYPELALWEQRVGEDAEVQIRGVPSVVKRKLKNYMDSAVLVQMLFDEHVAQITSLRTPVTYDVAVELALLHLQAVHGRGLQVAADGKSVAKVPSVDDVGEPPLSPDEMQNWMPEREVEIDWFLRKMNMEEEISKPFKAKKALVMEDLDGKLTEYKNSQKEPAAKILALAKNKKAWRKAQEELDFANYLPPDLKQLVTSNKKELQSMREKMVELFDKLPQQGNNFFQEARARYIELVKSQPTYGGEFFPAFGSGADGKKSDRVKRQSMFGGGDKKAVGKDPVLAGVVGDLFIVLNSETKQEIDRVGLREGHVLVRREDEQLVLASRGETLLAVRLDNPEYLLRLHTLTVNSINHEEKNKVPDADVAEVAPNVETEATYINFSKSLRTGKILQLIMQYQRAISKEIKADSEVVDFIRNYEVADEDKLYAISTELEPPVG